MSKIAITIASRFLGTFQVSLNDTGADATIACVHHPSQRLGHVHLGRRRYTKALEKVCEALCELNACRECAALPEDTSLAPCTGCGRCVATVHCVADACDKRICANCVRTHVGVSSIDYTYGATSAYFCDTCDAPLCNDHGMWYSSTESLDCGGFFLGIHICDNCNALAVNRNLVSGYGLDLYDGGEMDEFVRAVRQVIRTNVRERTHLCGSAS